MSDNIGKFNSEQPWIPAIQGSATQSNAVYGNTSSNKDSAVYGEHSGDGIGVFGRGGNNMGEGVFGQANSPASAVYGKNTSTGAGVTGESAGGFAMLANGDTSQARDRSGWVKALLQLHTPTSQLPVVTSVTRFFSAQPGLPTPTCYRLDRGLYCIDFHFKVSDRYVVATPLAPNYREIGDVAENPFAPLWWPPMSGSLQAKLRIANIVYDGFTAPPSVSDGYPESRQPNPSMITVITFEPVYASLGQGGGVQGFQLQDSDLSIVVF